MLRDASACSVQGHSRALRQDPALVFGADAVAKAKATAASQPAAATTFDPTRTSSGSQLDLDAKEAFMRFQKQQLEVEASSATGANRSKVAELEAARLKAEEELKRALGKGSWP